EGLVRAAYARVLALPRVVRRGSGLGYLLRALRNTFVSGLVPRRARGDRHPRALVPRSRDGAERATGDRDDPPVQGEQPGREGALGLEGDLAAASPGGKAQQRCARRVRAREDAGMAAAKPGDDAPAAEGRALLSGQGAPSDDRVRDDLGAPAVEDGGGRASREAVIPHAGRLPAKVVAPVGKAQSR